MMKIYTRTGDNGTTSLSDGSRISKGSVLLHAYGTVDELNSFIGAVISQNPNDFLTKVQNELFVVGGMLATPVANWEKYWKVERLAEFTAELEREIDSLSKLGGGQWRQELIKEKCAQLADLQTRAAQTAVDRDLEVSYKYTVDVATVADKKAYPKRMLIVLAGSLGAVIICIFGLLVFAKKEDEE